MPHDVILKKVAPGPAQRLRSAVIQHPIPFWENVDGNLQISPFEPVESNLKSDDLLLSPIQKHTILDRKMIQSELSVGGSSKEHASVGTSRVAT